MRNLRTEAEITRLWQGNLKQPIVSIRCATYNHANYIEDALEGFLIQETSFPFEIWVHDDASTDGAAAIIREYHERYPNLIKPILQQENQVSQGRRIANIFNNLCKGRYIAICEGDDYWTDPHKLQIQVDFLEANPEYVLSGHDASEIDQDGNPLKPSKLPDKHKRDYDGEDLILGNAWVMNMSRVYRNVIHEHAAERSMVRNGDTFMLSILGQYGKSKYHPEIKPAVYRKHSGGVWSPLSDVERLEHNINTFFWMYRYYSRKGQKRYADHYWNKMLGNILKRTPLSTLTIRLFQRLIGKHK